MKESYEDILNMLAFGISTIVFGNIIFDKLILRGAYIH